MVSCLALRSIQLLMLLLCRAARGSSRTPRRDRRPRTARPLIFVLAHVYFMCVCVHAIGVLGRRETTYYQLMKTPGGVCGRFFANVQRSSAVYILAKVGGGTAEDGPTKILKSVVLYRAPLVIPSRQGRVGRCNRW